MSLKIVHQHARDGVAVRALAGVIDEDMYPELLDSHGNRALVLDLSQISGASAAGARRWTQVVQNCRTRVDELSFVDASRRAMAQFNRIVGFDGGGALLSFYGSLSCRHCGDETPYLFDVLTDRALFRGDADLLRQCRTCGRDARPDDDPALLFDYAGRTSTARLSQDTAEVLLDTESAVPVIPGRHPTLRASTSEQGRWRCALAGNIDATFDGADILRMAHGHLDVELSLSFVQFFDELATSAWESFLDTLVDRSRVNLFACPPVFLRRMVENPGVLGNAGIQSLLWPMRCKACGARELTRLEVASEVATALPPCSSCHRSELEHAGRREDFDEIVGWIADNNDIEVSFRTRLSKGALFDPSDEIGERTVVGSSFAPPPGNAGQERYRILAQIAEGPMGPLSLVVQQGDGGFRRLLVAKSLRDDYVHDEELVRVFLEEARIGAFLDVPNVVRVHDVGRSERSFFMLVDFVHGETLRDVLDASPGGVMPPLWAAEATRQLAQALRRVHAATPAGTPLVHRDVTPDKVWLGFDGRLRLGDFGIAAHERALSSDERRGRILGSFPFLAPEIVRGDPGSPASDIWSAGLVLLELATGQRPFDLDSPEASAAAIVRGDPQLAKARLPRRLRRIVARCLSKEPAGRYASAAELERELASAVARLRPRSLPPQELPTALGTWARDLFPHERALEEAFVADTGAANLQDALLQASLADVERFAREWRGRRKASSQVVDKLRDPWA